MGGKTPGFLFLRWCSLAFLLCAAWACWGRLSWVWGMGDRGGDVGGFLSPYLLNFLSKKY